MLPKLQYSSYAINLLLLMTRDISLEKYEYDILFIIRDVSVVHNDASLHPKCWRIFKFAKNDHH